MNREIKFRVWYPLLKSMTSAQVMYLNNKELYFIVKGTSQINVPFDSVELMQYTGIKDKNGKEVYEGDVCELRYHKYTKFKTVRGIIEWYQLHTHFSMVGLKNNSSYSISCGGSNVDGIYVIGNIHENPELLK